MAVHKGVGHYGAPITLDQAKKVMAAAEAKALQNNWYVAISIMDSGGNPVMLHRLDGAQLSAVRIAEGKALTAVEVSPTHQSAGGRYRGRRRGAEILHSAKYQFDGGRCPDSGRWQGCR
jgi:uncharacterized protein GlcG (DUF336 family)